MSNTEQESYFDYVKKWSLLVSKLNHLSLVCSSPPWDTAPRRWCVQNQAHRWFPSAGGTARPCRWTAGLHQRWFSDVEPQLQLENDTSKAVKWQYLLPWQPMEMSSFQPGCFAFSMKQCSFTHTACEGSHSFRSSYDRSGQARTTGLVLAILFKIRLS